jgi:hypothetical protein
MTPVNTTAAPVPPVVFTKDMDFYAKNEERKVFYQNTLKYKVLCIIFVQ